MAVSPVDVYKVYLDPTMDVASKTAAIDMMYGGGAPPPEAGPDLRTADVSLSDAMTAAAGGNVPPSTLKALEAPRPPTSASVSDAMVAFGAGGNVTPSQRAALGDPVPPAPPPVSAPAAPAPARTETPAAPTPPAMGEANRGLNMLVASKLGAGGPSRYIPGHDQKTGSTVEYREAIPEELKLNLGVDALHGSAQAIQRGEMEAKQHTEAAQAAEADKRRLESERAANAARQAGLQEHAKKLDEGFEKLAKDTEVRPGDFWATKSTGQKVLGVIASIMFGLAGKPELIDKMIDDDVAARQKQREKLLGARKSAIDNFRAQMLSPEAANAADRALATQAAASEMTRLAESAKAPEARQRGLELAAQYQQKYNALMAEMAEKEAKAVRESSQYIPGHSTGGQMSTAQLYDYLTTKAHLAPNDALTYIASGKYNPGLSPQQLAQQQDLMKRAVVGPDGKLYYAGEEKDARQAKDKISNVGTINTETSFLESELAKGLAGMDRGAVEASRNRLIGAWKGMGVEGSKEYPIESLVGSSVGDLISMKAKGGLAKARQMANDEVTGVMGNLYTDPLDPTKRGGASWSEVVLPQ